MRRLLSITLFLSIAVAADLPEMKEGLWSIHTQITDEPGNKKSEGTYKLCRTHAFDQQVEARAKKLKGCTPISESLQGGKYSSQTRCVVAGFTIETKGVTSFQGDTFFRSEVHSTNTPAQAGVSATTMITEEKYLGSCPAGTQPGDRINADGTVMHLGKR